MALGTVVRADGFILTKASELQQPVRCQLADGRLLDAKVVGVERQHDLAMLKVDANGLPTVQWREGAGPPVGSWVATPSLSDLPLAIGVVSVAPRPIAAPAGVLGVFLEQSDDGPRISAIQPGSSADKAGLLVNDVITHIDGTPVENRQVLIQTVQQFRPGDKLQLSVRRGDQSLAILATLGAWPPKAHDDQPALQESLAGPLSQRRAGFPAALQHDTVLPPAACGGPLVDLDGKTVGINIARADRVSTYALPAAAVTPLLDQLQSGSLAPAPIAEDKAPKLARQAETAQTANRRAAPALETPLPSPPTPGRGAESPLPPPGQ